MAVIHPSPEHHMQTLIAAYGDKARTRIHLLGSPTTVDTTVPLVEMAHLLSQPSGALVHITKRLAHGGVQAMYLRAGAISLLEQI